MPNLGKFAACRRVAIRISIYSWVLKDTTGIDLPPPARKAIDLEGILVKDGVRKALQERQKVLGDLVQAIREYRKLSDQPLTLRGSEYAHSVLELNKSIGQAEGLLTG